MIITRGLLENGAQQWYIHCAPKQGHICGDVVSSLLPSFPNWHVGEKMHRDANGSFPRMLKYAKKGASHFDGLTFVLLFHFGCS